MPLVADQSNGFNINTGLYDTNAVDEDSLTVNNLTIDKSLTMPFLGTGVLHSNSSGVVSSSGIVLGDFANGVVSSSTAPNTIALRDGSGNLYCNGILGTSYTNNQFIKANNVGALISSLIQESDVQNLVSDLASKVSKTGDTMTGTLIINATNCIETNASRNPIILTYSDVNSSVYITYQTNSVTLYDGVDGNGLFGSKTNSCIRSLSDNTKTHSFGFHSGSTYTEVLYINNSGLVVGGITISGLGTGIVHSNSSGVLSSSLITNADVSNSAGIVYSKLSLSNSIVNADINSSAGIVYSKLSLSNSIVNADINSSAGIVYSKLSLANSIVNADINSSAGIAYSKLNLVGSIVDGDISSIASIANSKLNLSSIAQDITFNGTCQFTVNPKWPTATFSNFSTAGVLHNNSSGLISSSLIVDADVSSSASIASSKLNLGNITQNVIINQGSVNDPLQITCLKIGFGINNGGSTSNCCYGTIANGNSTLYLGVDGNGYVGWNSSNPLISSSGTAPIGISCGLTNPPQLVVGKTIVTVNATLDATTLSDTYATLTGGALSGLSGLTLSGFSTGILHCPSSGIVASSLIVDADISSSASISSSKLNLSNITQNVTMSGGVVLNLNDTGINNPFTIECLKVAFGCSNGASMVNSCYGTYATGNGTLYVGMDGDGLIGGTGAVIGTSGSKPISLAVGLSATPQLQVNQTNVTTNQDLIVNGVVQCEGYGAFGTASNYNKESSLYVQADYVAGYGLGSNGIEVHGFDVNQAYGMCMVPNSNTYGVVYVAFCNSAQSSALGSISINSGGTGVNYNTTSDYRLKRNVITLDFDEATTNIMKLRPVKYNWKPNNATGRGFIAHELQDVFPDCVTGEKDENDEKGNPKYQAIDTHHIIGDLVAVVQNQQKQIEQLKTQISPNVTELMNQMKQMQTQLSDLTNQFNYYKRLHP